MSDSVKNIHDFYKYNYNELLKEYIDTIEERDRLSAVRRRFGRRRSLRDRPDSERKNGDEEEG